MAHPENPLKVEREGMVVLYDPNTGRIVHIHHCVTAHGGQHPDDKALENEALALASQRGTDTDKLLFLHADVRSFKLDAHYKVDLQKRILVEIPKPTRK